MTSANAANKSFQFINLLLLAYKRVVIYYHPLVIQYELLDIDGTFKVFKEFGFRI